MMCGNEQSVRIDMKMQRALRENQGGQGTTWCQTLTTLDLLVLDVDVTRF